MLEQIVKVALTEQDFPNHCSPHYLVISLPDYKFPPNNCQMKRWNAGITFAFAVWTGELALLNSDFLCGPPPAAM